MSPASADSILTRLADSAFVRKTYFACRRIPLFAVHGKRIWTTVARGPGKGLWMLLEPRFDHDFSNGKHESWIQDLLTANLKAGDCFYDVGAHIGFFSLIAAKIVGPTGHVYAFEPDPQNVSLVKLHCERNEARRIAVMQTAVWDSSRELTFERSQEASSRMEGRVNQAQESKGDMIQIAAISLDDFFFSDGRGEPPNLIKIDVEGGEFEVLSGARRLLGDFRPSILCEIHSHETVKPVEKFLADCGYMFIESPAEAL